MEEIWRLGWTEGTATTRFRLVTLLAALGLLVVTMVSLVETVWLWVAHVVIWTLTS